MFRRIAITAAAGAILFALAGCKPQAEDPSAAMAKHAANLASEGKYDEAAALYDRILTDYPSSAQAKAAGERRDWCEAKSKFVTARGLARAGRFDEAGEVLSEAVVLAPDDVEINYGIGWVYIQTALDYMTKASMTRGAAAGDYYLLGKAQAELARGRFERCLKLDPRHWAGYRGMAVYYLFLGEEEQALEAANNALKYSTKEEDVIAALRLKFQVYAGQKNAAETKKVVDELVSKYPDRGEVYVSLAEYYLRLDKPDEAEAVKALETGVSKQFEDVGTRNQMYLLLSQLKLRQRDYDGALAAVETALASDPFNGALTDQFTVAFEAKAAAERQK